MPEGDTLNYDLFAERTDGYSGSDIKLVCKEAAMKPLWWLMKQIEDIDGDSFDWRPVDPRQVPWPDKVTNKDFDEALSTTKSASSIIKLSEYEKWMEDHGSV